MITNGPQNKGLVFPTLNMESCSVFGGPIKLDTPPVRTPNGDYTGVISRGGAVGRRGGRAGHVASRGGGASLAKLLPVLPTNLSVFLATFLASTSAHLSLVL